MVEETMNVNKFQGKAESKNAIWEISVMNVGCYLPDADCVTIVSQRSKFTLLAVFLEANHERREEVHPPRQN